MSVARWPDIRDAVQAAIALAAQLDKSQVIWRWQNANEPVVDYCTVGFSGIKTVGQDYLEQSYDASRSLGQEVALVVRGVRELTLEIECFAASTVPGQIPSNAPAVPGLDGMGRANLVSTSLLLPSVRSLLASVGIVPFDPQPVQNVPDVVSVGFRGRALLPVRCYAPAQAIAEYVGYITTVKGGIHTQPDGRTWPFVTKG